MIDIAEVITASEGFWDSTINWYNITPIMLFISVPIMFVIFLFGMMAFVDNDKRERVICAGICIISVAYIINSWTIYFTGWHPADVYAKPTWDTFVEEAYDVTIIADDANDELGDSARRPCVSAFSSEFADYIVDMTVEDANGYARDYRLIVKNDQAVVIDLDSDVIVTPTLESDELAERLITLAEW